MDAALQHLEGPSGWLAAECCAAITGLPLAAPFLLLEQPPEEDEDAPPALPERLGMDVLPGPPWKPYQAMAEAVRRWWAETCRGFNPERRYLRGRPFSPETLLSGLEDEPLRRRPALLFELKLRIGGTLWVEPRSWAADQRRQLTALLRLPSSALTSNAMRTAFPR